MDIKQIKKFANKLYKKLKYSPGGDCGEVIKRANGEIKWLSSEEYFKTDIELKILENNHFVIYHPNFTSPLKDRYSIIFQLFRYYLRNKDQSEYYKNKVYPQDKLAAKIAIYFLLPDKIFRKYYNKYYKDKNLITILSSIFLVSENIIGHRIKIMDKDNE